MLEVELVTWVFHVQFKRKTVAQVMAPCLRCHQRKETTVALGSSTLSMEQSIAPGTPLGAGFSSQIVFQGR